MLTLKELEANVKGCDCPETSASTLINGLADQLDALTHDPVAIKALAADLRKNVTALSQAICCKEKGEQEADIPHGKAKHGR